MICCSVPVSWLLTVFVFLLEVFFVSSGTSVSCNPFAHLQVNFILTLHISAGLHICRFAGLTFAKHK